MIEKLNSHYSFTNPASIHDEEALTALELSGRTAAKMNEVVEDQNNHREEIAGVVESQNARITARLKSQDELLTVAIANIPNQIDNNVEKKISNGTFDEMIGDHIGDLEKRVDNLIGSVTAGSTTMDAEVIDMRLDVFGNTHANGGTAIREQLKEMTTQRAGINFHQMNAANVDSTFAVNNRVVRTTYSKTGTYYGVSVELGMWDSIKDKKYLMQLTNNGGDLIDLEILVSNKNAWGGTGTVYKLLENISVLMGGDEIYIPLDLSECDYTGDTNTIRFLIRDNNKNDVGDITVCVYDVTEAHNTVGRAFQVIDTSNIKKVNNAGYDHLPDRIMYTHCVPKKDGDVVVVNVDGYVTSTPTNTDHVWEYYLVAFPLEKYVGKSAVIDLFLESNYAVKVMLSTAASNWTTTTKGATLGAGYNHYQINTDGVDLSVYGHLVVGIDMRVYAENGVFTVPDTYIKIDGRILNGQVVYASHVTPELKKELENIVAEGEQYITCWGDSLTAQSGWNTLLSQLSGFEMYNGGTGGENSRTITARQGGDVMMVNNITIPADTSPVTVATFAGGGIPTQLGYYVTPLLQGGAHVNPVSIGGVLGTLKWTGASYSDTTGTWTFTRSEAGEEIVINRPTAMLTEFDRNRNNPHLMVIFMGQNGGWTSLDELVTQHKRMIDHANAKHVIVLGLSSGTAESRSEYETRMRQEFGRYFISLREYLSVYGLDDAGLTATDEDTTAMSVGEVPPQLLRDSVHYTDACKTVIGNMLYKKCCELNIF